MSGIIKYINRQQIQQRNLNNVQVRLSVYHSHTSLAVMI